MSARRHVATVFAVVSAIVVLALMLTTARVAVADDATPKPGAASPAELMAKFGVAVDTGDITAARSCIDTTKPASADYANYVAKIAEVNAAKAAMLSAAEKKFGADVRTKAEAAAKSAIGGEAGDFGGMKDSGKDLAEGSTFYLPGFKGEAVLVKKDGVFLIDASGVLDGVSRDWMKEEAERKTKLAAVIRQVVETATTADDLLAKLAAAG